MLKQILMFAAIAVGFALGARLGGEVGSILGGVVAFAASLFVAERLEQAHEVRGYWLRYRAPFLEFGLAVLGLTLGGRLVGGFWGYVVGPALGSGLGLWLSERWGWSGATWQSHMDARSGYLAVLISAAHADGVITPAEADRITVIGRNIFADLGYGGEQDVAHIVAQLITQPAGVDQAAHYLTALAPDLQMKLQFEILRIIFAGGEPSTANRAWLDRCVQLAGLGEWSVLRYFDRAVVGVDQDRRIWLAELGLDETANSTAIRAAYRAGAQAYHPDRLAAVPAPVRALAEAKMAALNEAYGRLTSTATAPNGDGPLHFQQVDEVRSFRPEADREFFCRCWLCGQPSRVPAQARPETCRCGSCHALAGLTFDPTGA